jgi:hypothetical protein
MNKQCIAVAMVMVATACSNNDNSSSVTGLSLPQKIEAVSAADDNVDSPSAAGYRQVLNIQPTAFDDAGTDFATDETGSYVYEEGLQYIRSVNHLLCIVNELQYQVMVNAGPYTAAVDYQKCYEEIYPESNFRIPTPIIEATVNSSRADNSSPHSVKVWFPDFNNSSPPLPGMIAEQTLVEIRITQAPSESNPFGEFSLKFSNITDASLFGGELGEELQTSAGLYQALLSSSGEPIMREVIAPNPNITNDTDYSAFTILLKNSLENWGSIHTAHGTDESNVPGSLWYDFDSQHLLLGRYDEANDLFESQSCKARSETLSGFGAYNLYHKNDGTFRGQAVSAGQRIELNSSFSFDYHGLYGWMNDSGYYLENDAELPDGAVITKREFIQQEDEQLLTVVISPGAFTRYQRLKQSLAVLQGMELHYYGLHPNSGKYSSWIIQVTANNDFQIIKERVWTGSEYVESETYDHDDNPATPEVTVLADLVLQEGESIDFSTERNYQSYTYTFDAATPAEERVVFYSKYSRINAADSSLFPPGVTEVGLYCYTLCPKGGLTQEMVDNASDSSELYHSYSLTSTPWTYTARRDGNYVSLIDDTNGEAVDASQLDLSPHAYSLSSGRLLNEPLSAPVDYEQLRSAPVAYEWSTGKESYTKSVVLLDENNTVYAFDPPLEINYVYDAAHDVYNTDPQANSYDGVTFSLSYAGPGSLLGLPYINNDYDDYYPAINLKPGTEMSNSEGQYIVKATWEWQYFLSKELADCSGLSVEALLNDERLTLLRSDEIQPLSFSAADKPVIDTELSVKPGV